MASEHALISLLALNGLRVSEATGANIEALGAERGHRILVVTRKGGKVVTVPLAPRTARAIDPAIGERSDLLLCAHQYRVSRAALDAAGAAVFDGAGRRVMPPSRALVDRR
jgi:integrase